MRRRGRIARALALATGFAFIVPTAVQADGAETEKEGKVTLCHKGKLIEVGPAAAVAHILLHGDTVGTCEVVPPGEGAGTGI